MIISIPFLIAASLMMFMDVALNLDVEKYLSGILWLLARFIGLILFTFVAGNHMMIEFKTDVLKYQWTIPISRAKFYYVKIIFLSIWSTTTILIVFLSSMIFSYLQSPEQVTFEFISLYLHLFISASVLIWPFMYFTVMMVIRFKRLWIPMCINILLFILSWMMLSFSWSLYLPWAAPIWILFSKEAAGIYYSYMSLFIFTAVVVAIGHFRILKVEV
jgi:hypothetical protein